MKFSMSYSELYLRGKETLLIAGIREGEIDARLLLEYVCHTDRSYLLAHGEEAVSEEQAERFHEMLKKRAEHIPLQYITNEQDFMGLQFYVNQDVLIPRQDTECLVEEVMRELQDGMSVLDVCTGSGCILISLMKYKNGLRGVATDLSEKALAVAERNSRTHEVNDRLWLVQSDLFEQGEKIRRALQELNGESISETIEAPTEQDLFERQQFDFIVSNPPYIRSDVIEGLEPEVKNHEPRMALDGTEDGLYFYRRISEQAKDYMVSDGRIYFEIGYDQGQAVSDILAINGYCDIKVGQDLAGLDRVVSARKSM